MPCRLRWHCLPRSRAAGCARLACRQGKAANPTALLVAARHQDTIPRRFECVASAAAQGAWSAVGTAPFVACTQPANCMGYRAAIKTSKAAGLDSRQSCSACCALCSYFCSFKACMHHDFSAGQRARGRKTSPEIELACSVPLPDCRPIVRRARPRGPTCLSTTASGL